MTLTSGAPVKAAKLSDTLGRWTVESGIYTALVNPTGLRDGSCRQRESNPCSELALQALHRPTRAGMSAERQGSAEFPRLPSASLSGARCASCPLCCSNTVSRLAEFVNLLDFGFSMSQTTGMTSYTATRKNGKITITTSDGSAIQKGTVSGARVERATVVLVGQYLPESPVKTMGCRADPEAGKAEAHRLANNTTMRHRDQEFSVTPHVFCIAVPVVDATPTDGAER